MKTKFLLSLALSLVVLLSLAKTQIQAQVSDENNADATESAEAQVNESPINLTLSPVSLTIETTPGVPAQSSIKIRNNSDTTENLHITFGTFAADETGQKPRLLEPQANDAFMQWLTAEQTNFSIKPGEWKTIKLTFAPPADAALSYYYTAIINRDNVLQKPGETTIQGAPAVLILTTVKSPNARLELSLDHFQALFPMVEFLPQTFKVAIKNTGNVHIVPSGNIFIDGQGKKDLTVLSINPSNSAVLPQSTRTFEIPWKDGFPTWSDPNDPEQAGFKVWGTSWNLSHADRFRIGKYTAHILMVYDNGERDVPVESYVSFWVVPWRLLLIGLAILALVLVGTSSVIRKIWKWLRNLFKSPVS